jgi:hypothetical protein
MGFTGEITIGEGQITNVNVSTSADIARSKLAQDALKCYTIPIHAFRMWDMMGSLLPVTTASNDDMAIVNGTAGTDVPTLQGVDFGLTTSDEKCGFEFCLPAEYDAGQSVTLRVRAAILTTVADTSLTLDANCYKSNRDGLAGADIVATGAQNINFLAPANYDFTITPTGLTAGDRLLFVLTFAGVDGGNAGVMIPEISQVEILLDVRG